jgi:predicted nucleic acid-binding protein
MRQVELSAEVERGAGALAATHQLRGADAVHLASALALDVADLTVAVWDRCLHAGATAVGLAVAPAVLT